jgi:hypothetical protein
MLSLFASINVQLVKKFSITENYCLKNKPWHKARLIYIGNVVNLKIGLLPFFIRISSRCGMVP